MRPNQTLKYFSALINNISDLDGREKIILLKRLKKNTLVAIGKKWNITEGRVRQIEKEAISKIKSKTRQLSFFKILKRA